MQNVLLVLAAWVVNLPGSLEIEARYLRVRLHLGHSPLCTWDSAATGRDGGGRERNIKTDAGSRSVPEKGNSVVSNFGGDLTSSAAIAFEALILAGSKRFLEVMSVEIRNHAHSPRLAFKGKYSLDRINKGP
jgi:hypothetical protein